MHPAGCALCVCAGGQILRPNGCAAKSVCGFCGDSSISVHKDRPVPSFCCAPAASTLPVEILPMPDARPTDFDLIKEFRLRRWARRNYVAADRRLPTWHPVVLDEMAGRDCELENSAVQPTGGTAYVPLPPTQPERHDEAHVVPATPNLIQTGVPQHHEQRQESRI